MLTVSRNSFVMVREYDPDADLSWIGQYSDTPGRNCIDRQERRHMKIHQLRYFNATLSADETGNPDSVEQDYQRMEEYGTRWYMMSIRASVVLNIPHGGAYIVHRIESPGLYGIESDSGDDYFKHVFSDECAVLESMLQELGVNVVD